MKQVGTSSDEEKYTINTNKSTKFININNKGNDGYESDRNNEDINKNEPQKYNKNNNQSLKNNQTDDSSDYYDDNVNYSSSSYETKISLTTNLKSEYTNSDLNKRILSQNKTNIKIKHDKKHNKKYIPTLDELKRIKTQKRTKNIIINTSDKNDDS